MTPEEERKKDEQEFYRRRKLFEDGLVHTEAWKELVAIGQEQVNAQLQHLLELPKDGVDGMTTAMRDQYYKGVVFGIKVIISTPHATILTAKELLKESTRQSNVKEKSDDNRLSDDDRDQLPDGARVTDLS